MMSKTSGNWWQPSAAADMWRNTLAAIPSVFGRLVYLSALRNGNTGRYEHHGLAARHGQAQADMALRNSHREVFRTWREYPLAEQKADLDLYLATLFEPKVSVIETWLKLAPYRHLLPAETPGDDQQLYLSDFQALLAMLRAEYGVSIPDPDASPLP